MLARRPLPTRVVRAAHESQRPRCARDRAPSSPPAGSRERSGGTVPREAAPVTLIRQGEADRHGSIDIRRSAVPAAVDVEERAQAAVTAWASETGCDAWRSSAAMDNARCATPLRPQDRNTAPVVVGEWDYVPDGTQKLVRLSPFAHGVAESSTRVVWQRIQADGTCPRGHTWPPSPPGATTCSLRNGRPRWTRRPSVTPPRGDSTSRC